MYRRVLAPAGLAISIAAVTGLLGALSSSTQRLALNGLQGGRPAHWMLPVLPTGGWLLLLGVFFAVRLCALRGGTRRECLAVGLSPLAPALVYYLVVVASVGALPSLLLVLGSVAPIGQGHTGLGEAVMVRTATAHLLGLAGACLAATWLWFFMSRQGAAMATDPPV